MLGAVRGLDLVAGRQAAEAAAHAKALSLADRADLLSVDRANLQLPADLVSEEGVARLFSFTTGTADTLVRQAATVFDLLCAGLFATAFGAACTLTPPRMADDRVRHVEVGLGLGLCVSDCLGFTRSA